MENSKINWKKTWEDHDKLLKLIVNAHTTLAHIRNEKRKLEMETSLWKKIKNEGNVIEQKRKEK